jgi:hypothetical protein
MYESIDHFFLNIGFKRCVLDHNIYALHVNGDTLIVALYVHDLDIIRRNIDLILVLKKQSVDTFEMIDLSVLCFFLGVQVLQIDDAIFISQPKYALNLL